MEGNKKYKEAIELKRQYDEIWDTLTTEDRIKKVKNRILCLSKAAYLGHEQAQYELACFYKYGIYSDGSFFLSNKRKYIFWMNKSAENKYPPAVEWMAILYESEPKIQDFEKAKAHYELYDSLMGIKMSKNRRLFLQQLDKGLFIKNKKGNYELVSNWKKLIR